MMEEVWKDVVGYEGFYQVSNMGNVRSVTRTVKCADGSVRTWTGRPIKPDTKKNGYMQVMLRKPGIAKQRLVHRVVAEAFVPNHDGLPCVNHKDEKKKNNQADNLEWCDVLYNNLYGDGHISRANNGRESSIRSCAKPVCQYTLDGEFVGEYFSAMEAGRVNSINQGGISECCNGKQKTAYGYVWRYKEAQ